MKLFTVIFFWIWSLLALTENCPKTKYCQCYYNNQTTNFFYLCRNGTPIIFLQLRSYQNIADVTISCRNKSNEAPYNLLPNLSQISKRNFSNLMIGKSCGIPKHFAIVENLFPLIPQIFMRHLGLKHLNDDFFNEKSRIIGLDLSRNKLKNLNDSTFWSLRMLQKINLSENQFKTLPADLFKQNPCLRYFTLNNNKYDLQLQDKFLSNLKSLEVITLVNSSFQYLPESIFENSSRIQCINLRHNKITQFNG